MQFSTKIDGFEQKDSQGFESSYNSYEQYPLEKFLIFTIYQNYTLALKTQELLMNVVKLNQHFIIFMLTWSTHFAIKLWRIISNAVVFA